jgi:hypothetical protein
MKMDLFWPLVNDDRLHPLIKSIMKDKTYQPTMNVINGWSKGLLGRKGEANKFIKEFQTSFNSSLWELYLNKSFIDLGFEIDYTNESPDFHLTHQSGKVINVEAVTANNKFNESEHYYSIKSFQESAHTDDKEFLDQSTIKLAGKLKDKRVLFTGENNKKHPYCSMSHVSGNPFVIAVAPFDNHLSFSQNNMAINRVLYGIEPPKINSHGEMMSEKIPYIKNRNGKIIDLGIFTNDSYKEISAIMFSTTGMFGKAVVEAGISKFVRSTRYREIPLVEFMEKEGLAKLGTSHLELGEGNDVFSTRTKMGNTVYGSDMHLCYSKHHKETHLDGLHIYYNPFAETPLPSNIFTAYEITQNDYDIESNEMLCKHNDGSLVSRQTYTSFA